MGSTTMTTNCSNCKTRLPHLTSHPTSPIPRVTQYRCFCGYVNLIETTKPALAQHHHEGQQQQHSHRRRASSWINSHIKGSSPSSSSKNCKSPSPSPSSSSSSTSLIKSCGRKRALLCGVTYKARKYKLKGTYNDVNNMNHLLINTFCFPADCIRILSEEEGQPKELTPTKKNIEKSLKWLVEGCQAGDSLVFYFSGHGLRQPDFKDDEVDGFDETICPLDFMEEGMILDNDINSTIVHPLKEGVTLHAIVDACHSGTILDLLYVYDHKGNKWKDNSPPSGARKSTSGGLAICLSACEDDKMAADTTAFDRNVMNGAMTYILIEIIKNHSGKGITYGELLDFMFDQIQRINGERCLNSRILRKVFRHKIIQQPLLSSSEDFDVYKKKFLL
ncbi:metacaspase-1-like [Rosa rugosa]|uniref:metacaspase-1-like n=1 Tax=Rosa rugosa TaxID=74645 RepID=UPI002B417739|nr:metacaspase-1-like [Rosa rugosa]